MELWLARKAPSTQRKYAEDLDKFSDFTQGKPLYQVTLADLHDFAEFISILMAPSSQGRVLATIKSLLSFANKVGYLPFNVGAAVELPKVKNTLSEKILTEAEVHRIMNTPKNARDRALLSVLYAGALRREEAVRLKWRDLKDRDDLAVGVGQATLFGKGSKTGVALLPASVYSQVLALRTVPEKTPDGFKIERCAGEDEPVFRSRKAKNGRGGHPEVNQLNRIVAKAAKDAKIDRAVSPHWLRHAHASHAHARKTDLALIRNTLRHSSIATTGRYLPPDQTTHRRCTWDYEQGAHPIDTWIGIDVGPLRHKAWYVTAQRLEGSPVLVTGLRRYLGCTLIRSRLGPVRRHGRHPRRRGRRVKLKALEGLGYAGQTNPEGAARNHSLMTFTAWYGMDPSSGPTQVNLV